MVIAGKPKSEKKIVEREYNIRLVADKRADGSMFITSSNLAAFSAVICDGHWEDVMGVLKKFLEANVGKVVSMRLVHDASELVPIDRREGVPPAYVVAALKPENVRHL